MKCFGGMLSLQVDRIFFAVVYGILREAGP